MKMLASKTKQGFDQKAFLLKKLSSSAKTFLFILSEKLHVFRVFRGSTQSVKLVPAKAGICG